MNRIIKNIIFIITTLFLFALILPNLYIRSVTKNHIVENNYKNIKDVDCIVVLGAGVWSNGPSPILRDRLDKAIELYKVGVSKKIVMTGDHGQDDYDEVNAMKKYAIEKGIPSEDIFMDHAGFSTYDSMYRIKEVFGAKNIVVVTQKYHIYRSIYIAKKLGLNVTGVPAQNIKYGDRWKREAREFLALDKDYFKCMFKPKPKYLGEKISLKGNGNITNDK